MSNEKPTERINNLIREIYNRFDEEKKITISPTYLARSVYESLDPEARSPLDVQMLCVLQLKQMSRQICIKRNNEQEAEASQGTLFEKQLQPRYPTERPDTTTGETEDGYTLREYLTLQERRAIIARLKAEAIAKNTHAIALEAETEDLLRRGILHEGEGAA